MINAKPTIRHLPTYIPLICTSTPSGFGFYLHVSFDMPDLRRRIDRLERWNDVSKCIILTHWISRPLLYPPVCMYLICMPYASINRHNWHIYAEYHIQPVHGWVHGWKRLPAPYHPYHEIWMPRWACFRSRDITANQAWLVIIYRQFARQETLGFMQGMS